MLTGSDLITRGGYLHEIEPAMSLLFSGCSKFLCLVGKILDGL